MTETRPSFQDQLLAAVGQAIVALDLQGQITYWNPAAERLYGWSAGEVLGRSLNAVIGPVHPPGDAAGTQARPIEGESWSGELSVLRKDGSEFLAHMTDSPIRDADGQIVGVIGVSYDVTRQRVAMQIIAESEARFRTLFEDSPLPMVVRAPDGTVLAVNDALLAASGYSREDLLGKPSWSYVAPDHLEATIEHFHRAADGETRSFTNVLLHRTGRAIPVATRHVPIVVDGRVIGVYSVAQDLTEREQMEARLAALVGSSGDAIVGMDPYGIITDWNPAAERLYQYTPGEVVGQSIRVLAPPELGDEPDALLERVRHGEDVQRLETVRVRRDGQRVEISVTISALRDEVGTVTGFVGVARDVTDQRRAAEALRRSEEEFRALVEQAPDLIVRFDDERRIAYANPAAERVTGRLTADLIGKTAQEAQLVKESVTSLDIALSQVFDSGHGLNLDLPIPSDGDVATLQARLTPAFGSHGIVESVLCIARDVSDQRRADEERQCLYNELLDRERRLQALVEQILLGQPRRRLQAESAGPRPRLTPRERDILPLLARGLTNHQIGRELGLSPGTVKNQITRLLPKLGAQDRTHAVALAFEWGLLDD